MECPFNCRKNKYLSDRITLLRAELRQQKTQCRELQHSQATLESLFHLISDGYQILSIEKRGSDFYCTYLLPFYPQRQDNTRAIYLCKLPYQASSDWIAVIYLSFRPCCSVRITDIQVRRINQGFGSMLMRDSIAFLRSAGFRTVTGTICPTDFDHEDRLRHFYSKFGFDIRDTGNTRSLLLSLTDKPVVPIEKNGVTVCCRSGSYLSAENALDTKG